MHKTPKKSAETTKKGPPKSPFELVVGTLESTDILSQYLNTEWLARLNTVSKTTHKLTAAALKKQTLEKLLSAAVCGNETLAQKIVTSRPELLLDSSATVTDISGKKIKGLTPLQAAICAGDVDMVQMISGVLQQKLKDGIKLSFVPEDEMRRQFTLIYPEGLDLMKAEQIAKAQKFKTQESENVFNLKWIFERINAAQDADVQYELTKPGQHTDSQLNTDLHNFREQFTTTSNVEEIFNPFYLLKAFEFYDEQFDNFTGNNDKKWNGRNLFWRQVIGYIQRDLPACYLQAFAQDIYATVENGEKLKRDFEFSEDKGFYIRPDSDDGNNLGYKYACGFGEPLFGFEPGSFYNGPFVVGFSKFIANKKIRFGEIIYRADRPNPPRW